MTNRIARRFSDIAAGRNLDSSDEYYTLYHAFMALVLELMARFKAGKTYKVIICPCDSETSIFRELESKKEYFGNPKIIYSFWPNKDWNDYFDIDFVEEYGCSAEDVCIFTNPPFKGLSSALKQIRSDYLLFGSNAVQIVQGVFAKDAGGFFYIKNNTDYKGNADEFAVKYGSVRTFFYSNRMFLTHGKQYINETDRSSNVFFGRQNLKRVN